MRALFESYFTPETHITLYGNYTSLHKVSFSVSENTTNKIKRPSGWSNCHRPAMKQLFSNTDQQEVWDYDPREKGNEGGGLYNWP